MLDWKEVSFKQWCTRELFIADCLKILLPLANCISWPLLSLILMICLKVFMCVKFWYVLMREQILFVSSGKSNRLYTSWAVFRLCIGQLLCFMRLHSWQYLVICQILETLLYHNGLLYIAVSPPSLFIKCKQSCLVPNLVKASLYFMRTNFQKNVTFFVI